MTLIPGPAPPSKFSMPTARWKRSAEAVLVGFGGLAGAVSRQRDHLLVHSPQVIQRIATR
jgi:hypothetical protein